MSQRPKSPLGVAETKARTILSAKSVKNISSRSWQTSGKGIVMSTSFRRPYLGARFELPCSSKVNQMGGGVMFTCWLVCCLIKQVQTQAFRLDLVQASLALALWPNSVVTSSFNKKCKGFVSAKTQTDLS